jgi:hypothetical protein
VDSVSAGTPGVPGIEGGSGMVAGFCEAIAVCAGKRRGGRELSTYRKFLAASLAACMLMML